MTKCSSHFCGMFPHFQTVHHPDNTPTQDCLRLSTITSDTDIDDAKCAWRENDNTKRRVVATSAAAVNYD